MAAAKRFRNQKPDRSARTFGQRRLLHYHCAPSAQLYRAFFKNFNYRLLYMKIIATLYLHVFVHSPMTIRAKQRKVGWFNNVCRRICRYRLLMVSLNALNAVPFERPQPTNIADGALLRLYDGNQFLVSLRQEMSNIPPVALGVRNTGLFQQLFFRQHRRHSPSAEYDKTIMEFCDSEASLINPSIAGFNEQQNRIAILRLINQNRIGLLCI